MKKTNKLFWVALSKNYRCRMSDDLAEAFSAFLEVLDGDKEVQTIYTANLQKTLARFRREKEQMTEENQR